MSEESTRKPGYWRPSVRDAELKQFHPPSARTCDKNGSASPLAHVGGLYVKWIYCMKSPKVEAHDQGPWGDRVLSFAGRLLGERDSTEKYHRRGAGGVPELFPELSGRSQAPPHCSETDTEKDVSLSGPAGPWAQEPDCDRRSSQQPLLHHPHKRDLGAPHCHHRACLQSPG